MLISACGLWLDNEAVRIAVGLKLGVDAGGTLVAIETRPVWQALCKANIPSIIH